jgi:hypothetical protein
MLTFYGAAPNHNPSSSASPATGIIHMYHCAWLGFETVSLLTFGWPRALNHDLSISASQIAGIIERSRHA